MKPFFNALRARREWSFLPWRKHADSVTGIVHHLPPVVIEDGIGIIVSCGGGGYAQHNTELARLFSAAPDLLFALEEIVSDYRDRFGYDNESTKAVVEMARRAIAKATGESPTLNASKEAGNG